MRIPSFHPGRAGDLEVGLVFVPCGCSTASGNGHGPTLGGWRIYIRRMDTSTAKHGDDWCANKGMGHVNSFSSGIDGIGDYWIQGGLLLSRPRVDGSRADRQDTSRRPRRRSDDCASNIYSILFRSQSGFLDRPVSGHCPPLLPPSQHISAVCLRRLPHAVDEFAAADVAGLEVVEALEDTLEAVRADHLGVRLEFARVQQAFGE